MAYEGPNTPSEPQTPATAAHIAAPAATPEKEVRLMGLAVAVHCCGHHRQVVRPRRRAGHPWLLLLAQAQAGNMGCGCRIWRHRSGGRHRPLGDDS